MSEKPQQLGDYPAGRTAHVLAWVLAVGVFPLIWMGGLVTTYGAGMAVPDWPTTYGHWFYPVQKWLWGLPDVVWDLFLEHGHRTIAQAVGLVTIALVVMVWRNDSRKWMRWLVGVALAGVIFQGTLGGFRVVCESEGMPNAARVLAKTHGCTAPLFFALAAVLVTLTSRRWQQPVTRPPSTSAPVLRGSMAIAGLVFVEIFVGTQIRHLPSESWPGWFTIWVWTKVILAALLAIGATWWMMIVMRRHRDQPILVRAGTMLVSLLTIQVVLAIATWVTKYQWPNWFTSIVGRIGYTIQQEGSLQVLSTTAHTATGSLLLVAAVHAALWSFRILGSRSVGEPE